MFASSPVQPSWRTSSCSQAEVGAQENSTQGRLSCSSVVKPSCSIITFQTVVQMQVLGLGHQLDHCLALVAAEFSELMKWFNGGKE